MGLKSFILMVHVLEMTIINICAFTSVIKSHRKNCKTEYFYSFIL